MILTYADKKLQKLCEDEREMIRRRSDIARKLKRRIEALRANETLDDLVNNYPLGGWHRLTENRLGQWAGKVSSNERIVIEPMSDGVRIVDIDREYMAREVKVVDVGIDYHRR